MAPAVFDDLAERLFGLGPAIRYVAVNDGGDVRMAAREMLPGASAPESDRYEELLVNPTLLGLATARGDIDCRGLDYLVVRYGNFFQLVVPMGTGHLSVCVARDEDPIALLPAVQATLNR